MDNSPFIDDFPFENSRKIGGFSSQPRFISFYEGLRVVVSTNLAKELGYHLGAAGTASNDAGHL